MTSPAEQSHTPLLKNPWFYGALVSVGLFMFLVAAGSPQIKDPWFWQSDDRGSGTKITRGKLLRQLEKYPEKKAIGNPDAPVTVTEYTDFQCPACRQYALRTFPHVLRNFIQTGHVYYRVRHFPLEDTHEMALPAAIGAECAADQEVFWQYKKLVLDNQSKLSDELLFGLSDQLDLEQPELYSRCLNDRTSLSDVRSDRDAGLERNVNSTPTFIINDRVVRGAKPYRTMARVIREALHNAPQP